jgi:hypothetical protein
MLQINPYGVMGVSWSASWKEGFMSMLCMLNLGRSFARLLMMGVSSPLRGFSSVGFWWTQHDVGFLGGGENWTWKR